MQRIGFIGLGIMGLPMATNLLKANYEVRGFNRSPLAIEQLVSRGGIGAQSVAEVAASCDTIITMLPNSPDVKSVALGENGIIQNAQPGTLLIDMSSIAPAAAQEIAAQLQAKGIRMLDAPVSGGEPKAVDGTLAIMAGGNETDYSEALPIFNVLGSSAVLVGPIGSGNTCKLANQVIVAANIAAVSEGLMLARMAGADPEKVFKAIKGGLAGSTAMNAKAPMMLADEFNPGFKVDLHIKDLDNALKTGAESGSPLPITAEVMQMFERLHADQMGQYDHSALIKYYEKLTGTTLGV